MNKSFLGMSKQLDRFAENIDFILKHLETQVQSDPFSDTGFGRIYHYRDHEKVLCCFLPLLGFYSEPAVKYITGQRIKILYEFTRQMRYDIYTNGKKFGGVKKNGSPLLSNPIYMRTEISRCPTYTICCFSPECTRILRKMTKTRWKILSSGFSAANTKALSDHTGIFTFLAAVTAPRPLYSNYTFQISKKTSLKKAT